MRRTTLAAAALGVAVLALSVVRPAEADWLVTTSGDRLETQGPWKVKGAVVVFTHLNGALSSLRLSEVDLEASRAETEASKTPSPLPAPPAPKKPIAVITDKDIPRAQAAPPAAAEGEGQEAGQEAAPAPAADGEAEPPPATKPAAPRPEVNPGLVVKSWRQTQEPGEDVQILGTVENITGSVVTNLEVSVRLLGADGEVVGEVQASVIPPAIAAGGTTNFRALFPGVRSFVNPSFEVRSSGGGTIALPPKSAGGDSPQA